MYRKRRLWCWLPGLALWSLTLAGCGNRSQPSATFQGSAGKTAGPAVVEPAQPVGLGNIPGRTLDQLKAATVLVKAAKDDWVGAGSGVVISRTGDQGLILTNHHVVSHPSGLNVFTVVTVVFHSGRDGLEQAVRGEVVAEDLRKDLALVRVKGVARLPEPVALGGAGPVATKQTVFVLGFPFAEKPADISGNPALSIGQGEVTSLRQDDRGECVAIQINGDLNPGNSGGPVVDDRGSFAGIAVAKTRGANTGFVLPASQLGEFLAPQVLVRSAHRIHTGAGSPEIAFDLDVIDPLGVVLSPTVRVARRDQVPGGWVRERLYERTGQTVSHPPLPQSDAAEVTIDPSGRGGKIVFKARPPSVVAYLVQLGYQGRGVGEFFHAPERCVLDPRPTTSGKDGLPPVTFTPLDWKHFDPPGVNRHLVPTVILPDDPSPESGRSATRQLVLAGEPIAPCLAWAEHGAAVYVPDEAGRIRRVSFPGLKEEAVADLGGRPTAVAVSRRGVVVALGLEDQVTLLDPLTLKVCGNAKVPGASWIGRGQSLISSPALDWAFVLTTDGIAVLDPASGRIARTLSRADLRLAGNDLPCCGVVSRDGRHLITGSQAGQIGRYAIRSDQLAFEQSVTLPAWKHPASGTRWLNLSVDGRYVALLASDQTVRGPARAVPGVQWPVSVGHLEFSVLLCEPADLSTPAIAVTHEHVKFLDKPNWADLLARGDRYSLIPSPLGGGIIVFDNKDRRPALYGPGMTVESKAPPGHFLIHPSGEYSISTGPAGAGMDEHVFLVTRLSGG